jgi:pimeloyl-ACP methyl ester carboxylesterase
MQEKRVAVSRGSLVYLEHGHGEQVAFFHGGLATPRAYIPLLELLGNHFHIIAPTHPGHGDSFRLPNVWSLDDFLHTYMEFFKKLRSEPAILIGHSFGGLLALLLAAAGIGKRAVLFSPTGLPFQPTAKAYLAAKQREISELLAYAKDSTRVKQTLSAAGTLLYTATRHPENIPWLTRRLPLLDISKRLHDVRIPVVLLWGEDDGIVPVSTGRLMQLLLPKAELRVLPGKGHTYPVTDVQFSYQQLMGIFSKK